MADGQRGRSERTRRLVRSDYALDPVPLAKALIGATIVRLTPAGRLAARIVETEAYLGPDDRAAHSFGARRTARTEPMFGEPGTSYVFQTYGHHFLFNVVCGRPGWPVAVLVRAGEPVEGLDAMEAHRLAAHAPLRSRPIRVTDLCSGPAKLARALDIGPALNGVDLAEHPAFWIEGPLGSVPEADLANTKRIGVDYAREWADRPLRWYLRGSPHVSRPMIPAPVPTPTPTPTPTPDTAPGAGTPAPAGPSTPRTRRPRGA